MFTKYAHEYCFIWNTYPLELNVDGTINASAVELAEKMSPADRAARSIGYYQWVPIMLLVQALLYWLPSQLWRVLVQRIGVNTEQIIAKAKKIAKDGTETAADYRALAADVGAAVGLSAFGPFRQSLISDWDFKRSLSTLHSSTPCRLPLGVLGCAMTFVYISIKLLNLLSTLAQFHILIKFLGVDSFFWGNRVSVCWATISIIALAADVRGDGGR